MHVEAKSRVLLPVKIVDRVLNGEGGSTVGNSR